MSGSDTVDRRAEIGWHLKKEVPIATILAIILTVFTATIFIVGLRGDLDTHITMDQETWGTSKDNDKLILEKLDNLTEKVTAIKLEQAYRYGRFEGNGGFKKDKPK